MWFGLSLDTSANDVKQMRLSVVFPYALIILISLLNKFNKFASGLLENKPPNLPKPTDEFIIPVVTTPPSIDAVAYLGGGQWGPAPSKFANHGAQPPRTAHAFCMHTPPNTHYRRTNNDSCRRLVRTACFV